MQVTLRPNSEKQAPVTNPTQPVPITLICMGLCPPVTRNKRAQYSNSTGGEQQSYRKLKKVVVTGRSRSLTGAWGLSTIYSLHRMDPDEWRFRVDPFSDLLP